MSRARDLADSADLTFDGDTLKIDSANNRVGIGTSSPSHKLTVGGAGTAARIEVINTSDSNRGGYLRDTGTSFEIGTQSGVRPLGFAYDYSEKMRIDSSGNVLIGKTTTASTTDGINLQGGSSGGIVASASSTSTNLATASGAGLHLHNNSATDGNFSHIGGYASTGYVTSQIDFINTSHANKAGETAFLTRPSGGGLTERMRIDSSGNVGIGTNSPQNALDVRGTVEIGDGSTQRMYLQGTGTAFRFYDRVNTTERMRIDSSGNVGIGTSSPNYKLDIVGSSQNLVELTSSGSFGTAINITQNTPSTSILVNSTSTGDIVDLRDNGTTVFTVKDGGNVGIGTSSPAQKLHVSAANPFLELQGTSASSGDTGIFINANGNHWILKADNYSSTNQFQIKQGDTSSSTATLAIDSSSNLKFNSGYGSVATAYGVRAWVNFTGTGTPAVKDSGNVSSIVDNGVGNYGVMFTTNMPDTNYAAVATCGLDTGGSRSFCSCDYHSTANIDVLLRQAASNNNVDAADVHCVVVR